MPTMSKEQWLELALRLKSKNNDDPPAKVDGPSGTEMKDKKTSMRGEIHEKLVSEAIGVEASSSLNHGANGLKVNQESAPMKAPAHLQSEMTLGSLSPVRLPQTGTKAQPLRRNLQCSSSGLGTFGCCAPIAIQQLGFSSLVCVNVTAHPETASATLNLLLDDTSLVETTISANNPAPLCVPVPQFPPLTLCVRAYDIGFAAGGLRFCINLEAQLGGVPLLVVRFECVRVRPGGVTLEPRPPNLPFISIGPFRSSLEEQRSLESQLWSSKNSQEAEEEKKSVVKRATNHYLPQNLIPINADKPDLLPPMNGITVHNPAMAQPLHENEKLPAGNTKKENISVLDMNLLDVIKPPNRGQQISPKIEEFLDGNVNNPLPNLLADTPAPLPILQVYFDTLNLSRVPLRTNISDDISPLLPQWVDLPILQTAKNLVSDLKLKVNALVSNEKKDILPLSKGLLLSIKRWVHELEFRLNTSAKSNVEEKIMFLQKKLLETTKQYIHNLELKLNASKHSIDLQDLGTEKSSSLFLEKFLEVSKNYVLHLEHKINSSANITSRDDDITFLLNNFLQTNQEYNPSLELKTYSINQNFGENLLKITHQYVYDLMLKGRELVGLKLVNDVLFLGNNFLHTAKQNLIYLESKINAISRISDSKIVNSVKDDILSASNDLLLTTNKYISDLEHLINSSALLLDSIVNPEQKNVSALNFIPLIILEASKSNNSPVSSEMSFSGDNVFPFGHPYISRINPSPFRNWNGMNKRVLSKRKISFLSMLAKATSSFMKKTQEAIKNTLIKSNKILFKPFWALKYGKKETGMWPFDLIDS